MFSLLKHYNKKRYRRFHDAKTTNFMRDKYVLSERYQVSLFNNREIIFYPKQKIPLLNIPLKNVLAKINTIQKLGHF